jgi:hypothetical protein
MDSGSDIPGILGSELELAPQPQPSSTSPINFQFKNIAVNSQV